MGIGLSIGIFRAPGGSEWSNKGISGPRKFFIKERKVGIWYIQLVPNTYVSRAKTTDSAYFFTAVKNRQNLFIFLEVTDKAVEV